MSETPPRVPEALRAPGPVTERRILRRTHRALVVSSFMALFGLAVTFAHFLLPSPLMFTLFMTAGQGAFVLAVLIYLGVILWDLRRRKVL